MPNLDCRQVVDQYIDWLSRSFDVEHVGSACLLTTPFLAPDGDHIEIKVDFRSGNVIVSDDGFAYDFLYMSGIDLDGRSPTRQLRVATILNNNHVRLDEGELVTAVADDSDVGPAIHRLIRAIQGVQHLVLTTKEAGIRTFRDKVAEFFEAQKVPYASDITIPGKALLEHRFDFAVYRNNEPPIAIRALSTSNSVYAKRLARDVTWAYMDARQAQSRFVAVSVLDDESPVWDKEAYVILKEYSDHVFFWSDRDNLNRFLVA